MNFSRKTILVVGAALLAACGDKVTVAEYTPPTPVAKVNFVEVTPASATVNTGASITFTAAVNADAGLATTVTWTASAGTVTSAGVFTAPSTANPGISVCAASTVDTGKKGCASVVVTSAPVALPASISISSITVGGLGAGLNVPVNPAAVAGQIDIRLNVNPGNQTVSKVVLIVGGVRTDSQTFTAAQSAALRYAADEAVVAQSTFPQIVFSINTAAFNATTGIPTWANGSRAISAQLYTTQSGTATAATASVATSLTFANADTYVLTLGAAATTANSTPGYAYRSGNLVASVLPVIYNTGRAIGTASLTFGTAGCDNTIPASGRTRALTAPAAGSSLWTTTFDAADTNGPLASNVTGYEFNALACNPAIGEGFILTAADANGNAMLTAVAPANGPVVRLDNLAPTVPTLAVVGGALTIGVRTGGWINDAVMFNGTSVANGAIAVAGVEGGVGGLNYRAAVGGVTMSTPATLAESQAANDYTVSVYSRDALGNESLNVDATFAVDRTAPAVAFGADPASNTGYAAGIASWVGTSVTDPATAPALASGFVGLGGTPLTVAQSRRNATNTRHYCPTSNTFELTTFVCAAWAATTTNYASVMEVLTNDVVAGDSYITTTATVFDQAGNTSAAVTRVFATDLSVPTVALLTPFTIPANGASLAVTGSMVDNLHLRGQQIDFTVLGGTPTGLAAVAGSTDRFFPIAPAAVDAYNPTTLTTSGGFSQTIPRFIAQWQVSDGLIPSGYAVQFPTTALTGVAVNVASIASVAAAAGNTAIVAPASAAIVGDLIYSWPAAQFLSAVSFTPQTTICRDGITSSCVQTRLIRADLTVPLTTANPFERVQFWAYQAGAGTLSPSLIAGNLHAGRAGWRYLGEVTQATVIDGATRMWRFDFSWNPTADQLPFRTDAATRVMAVGVAGGSALMSPVSAVITVSP